jgi:hypothetical protein
LPLAFRTELASIPASVPYLYAEPQRVAAWRERLGPRRRMRIGIVWSGNPSHANDRNRSIPLVLLSGILSRHDIDFHILQIVVREADRATLESLPQLRSHIAELAEMADTAALVSLMDLVITVDTAAAHLGGALGLPTGTGCSIELIRRDIRRCGCSARRDGAIGAACWRMSLGRWIAGRCDRRYTVKQESKSSSQITRIKQGFSRTGKRRIARSAYNGHC